MNVDTLEWFLHRADARAGDTAKIRASRLVPSEFAGMIAVDRIGPYVQALAPQPLFFVVDSPS